MATPTKTAEKKPRKTQTKAQKAQAALDVIERKVARVQEALKKAEAEVTDLRTEEKELLAERDYAKSNPALKPAEPTTGQEAPGELPGTTTTP